MCCEKYKTLIELVLATITTLSSILAIIISVNTAKKQNKIALLEKRLMILEKVEDYISKLGDWEFDYCWFLKLSISSSQLYVLFDKNFSMFYDNLEATSIQINTLRGDLSHAQIHGNCNGKSEDDIESEIQSLASKMLDEFTLLKGKLYKKYLHL